MDRVWIPFDIWGKGMFPEKKEHSEKKEKPLEKRKPEGNQEDRLGVLHSIQLKGRREDGERVIES